jgi:hypothetical protein
MAQGSPETGGSIITSVIDRMRLTRQLMALHQNQFGEATSLEPEMDAALDEFSLDNLGHLAIGQPLRGDESLRDLAATLDRWANHQKRRDLGAHALEHFVARQNEAISELLRGQLITVARLEDAGPRTIATHPFDGMQPVDDPLTMVFRDVHVATSRLGLGLRETETMTTFNRLPRLEPQVYAFVLDTNNQPQLDLTLAGPAGSKSGS